MFSKLSKSGNHSSNRILVSVVQHEDQELPFDQELSLLHRLELELEDGTELDLHSLSPLLHQLQGRVTTLLQSNRNQL